MLTSRSHTLHVAGTSKCQTYHHNHAKRTCLALDLTRWSIEEHYYGHEGISNYFKPTDPNSDIIIRAAFSVGRALAIRENHGSQCTQRSLSEIEQASRSIEKQLKHLDDFRIWGETVQGHGKKSAERAERMKAELHSEILRLDTQLISFKANAQGE